MTDAAAPPGALAPDLRRFARAGRPDGDMGRPQLATFVLTGRALGPEAFGLGCRDLRHRRRGVRTSPASAATPPLVREIAVDRTRRPRRLGPRADALRRQLPPGCPRRHRRRRAHRRPRDRPRHRRAHRLGRRPRRPRHRGRRAAPGRARPSCRRRPRPPRGRAPPAPPRPPSLRPSGPPTPAPRRSPPPRNPRSPSPRSSPSAATRAFGFERSSVGFGLSSLILNGLARSLATNLDRIVLAAVLPPVALGVYAAGCGCSSSAPSPTRPRHASLPAHSRRSRQPRALAGLTRGARSLWPPSASWRAPPSPPPLASAPAARPWLGGSAGVAAALGLACPFVALQYPPADALTALGRQPLRPPSPSPASSSPH